MTQVFLSIDAHHDLKAEALAVVASLKACAKQKDLHSGSRWHAHSVKWGLLEKSSHVGNTLVSMYAKCGALVTAQRLLCGLPVRDVVSWSALIGGYAEQGHGQDAILCFHQMQLEGLSPNAVTYINALKACGRIKDVDKGEQIHDSIAKQGLLEEDVVLGNALVDMYAKCGALGKAHQVLKELPSRNVISWSALIAGYAQEGKGQAALNCFDQMQCEGLSPNAVTFLSIVKACASLGATDKGEWIHDEIARHGLLGKDIAIGNALVDMYCKCGALAKAKQVLEDLPVRDVVSWSALIAGYADHGQGQDALNCFEQMQSEGLSPNAVTFVSVLKACASIGATHKGEQFHDEIKRQGLLGKDFVLGNAVVDMYAKCGALIKAQRVLEELRVRDVVSWSALIAGYVQQGQGQDALVCFERMRRDGLSPDSVTYISILKACGSIKATSQGEQIHDEIVRRGLLGKDNAALGNALVDMYAKCGALAKAKQVLLELPVRDVISWSALIAGYADRGQGWDALDCLNHMRSEGLSPNAITFICILKACGSIGAAEEGEQIHDEIVGQGLLGSNTILGNALVDMYAKCGNLGKAQQVLEELSDQDVISWNALITGYANHGQGEEALHCFDSMQDRGISPDEITFLRILKACGSVGAADKGKQIHEEVASRGLLSKDSVLGNAVVDMYAKCGALERARQVLDELYIDDVVAWSSLIAAYGQGGLCYDASSCFEQMILRGVSPDGITFLCLLNACSHSGLVDEGQMYFANMNVDHNIVPDVEHFTCIVDLLGRAGHFDKAKLLIQRMPSFDYPAVWSALMGACQKWGDVNVGRWAFEHALQIDKSDVAAYVSMANIYAAARMHEEAENLASHESASCILKERQDAAGDWI